MQKPKIFVSYSLKDVAWARQFVEALASNGVDVWFDAYRIPPGSPIQAEIEKGLRESDLIVTLITPESAQTPNLFFELGAAVGMGKAVVPIVPRGMDLSQLPHPLRLRQVLVRSTPKETAKQLVAQIKPQLAAA